MKPKYIKVDRGRIYLSKELLKKCPWLGKKPSKKELKHMRDFAKRMKIEKQQHREDSKKLCKIFARFKRHKFNHNQSKEVTIPYVSKETALSMVLSYMSMRMGMQVDIIKEVTKNKKHFTQEIGAFVHGRGHSTNYAILLRATNKHIDEAIKIVNKYF